MTTSTSDGQSSTDRSIATGTRTLARPDVVRHALDAAQVFRSGVAWLPADGRRAPRELDDVLAGTAADLQHVAGLVREEGAEHRPDRLVVAMEGRCIESAFLIGCLCGGEVDDVFRHHDCPKITMTALGRIIVLCSYKH